jgi:toxin CptA
MFTAISGRLELKPSKYLAAALLLGHSLVLIAPWLTALPLWGILGLNSLTLAVLAYHGWAWVLCRHPKAVLAFHREGDAWCLHTRQRTLLAELLPNTVVTPWLIIMGLRCRSHRRINLVIVADSLPANAFRQLSAYLRLLPNQ